MPETTLQMFSVFYGDRFATEPEHFSFLGTVFAPNKSEAYHRACIMWDYPILKVELAE